MEKPKNKSVYNWAKYSTLAIQMVIIICLCAFLGVKCDSWLQTNFPIFTFLLSILGIIAAIYIAIKDVLIKNKRNRNKTK